MKAFIVNSKNLFDRGKNPDLCLSAEKILKNNNIEKTYIRKKKSAENIKYGKYAKNDTEQNLWEKKHKK